MIILVLMAATYVLCRMLIAWGDELQAQARRADAQAQADTSPPAAEPQISGGGFHRSGKRMLGGFVD